MTMVALSKTSTDTPSTPKEGQSVEEWWAEEMKDYQDRRNWSPQRRKEQAETLRRLRSPDLRWVTRPSTVTQDDPTE
jgi:hypothetical protein